MKTRKRPAPGPGRGHFSVKGQAKRERDERHAEAMRALYERPWWESEADLIANSWGGPAKGAHPAKPRTLPQREVVDFDGLDDIAEREAEFARRGVIWRAKAAALDARRARLRAYRQAVLFGGPRPTPAFICRYSPGQVKPQEVTPETPGARERG